MLLLDNYGGGPTSPYNSWVLGSPLKSQASMVEDNEDQRMGQWTEHDS